MLCHCLLVAALFQLPVQSASAQPGAAQAPATASEDLAGAEARYRSAIALNPDIAAYHASLALVLERKGQVAEALAEHRQAVSLDSMSARNRAGLGRLLLREGLAAEAAVHLRVAAEADPVSVPVRLELAQALVAAKQIPEAITVLEQAKVLAPSDSIIARALAEIAPVTAPSPSGYHDYSGFADDATATRWFRRNIERVFAVVLGIASLALLAPIAGGILVLLAEVPRRLLTKRPA